MKHPWEYQNDACRRAKWGETNAHRDSEQFACCGIPNDVGCALSDHLAIVARLAWVRDIDAAVALRRGRAMVGAGIAADLPGGTGGCSGGEEQDNGGVKGQRTDAPPQSQRRSARLV